MLIGVEAGRDREHARRGRDNSRWPPCGELSFWFFYCYFLSRRHPTHFFFFHRIRSFKWGFYVSLSRECYIAARFFIPSHIFLFWAFFLLSLFKSVQVCSTKKTKKGSRIVLFSTEHAIRTRLSQDTCMQTHTAQRSESINTKELIYHQMYVDFIALVKPAIQLCATFLHTCFSEQNNEW